MTFKYTGTKRKVESVARRSRESSGDFDNYIKSEVSMFKPAEGENCVRILPPTWDLEEYGDGWEIPVFIHYGVGADNAVYLCANKMKNEPCPVCDAREQAADKEEADELRANKRLLCYVIDRDNEKAGPQVWSMPASLFRDINTRSIDKRTNALILLDDPENGFDLTFTREGSKLNTKYVGVDVARDPSPLHDNEKKQARWLQYIQDNPIPEILQYYEPERIEKVLFGGSAKRAEEEETEDEDAPRRSRRAAAPVEDEEEEEKPRRSRRADAEEEDTEEEEIPRRRARLAAPVEDEEEEEKPRRSRRSAVAEDDDEDAEEAVARPTRRAVSAKDADDDEEEEEKPRRSRRAVAEEEEEDEDPTEQARESMSRLRSRRSK